MNDSVVVNERNEPRPGAIGDLLQRFGLGILIAAHVAATAWVQWQSGWLLTIPFVSVWHFIAMFGLPASQCILCALWMALGPPPGLWRFVLTCTMLVLVLHVALRSLRQETLLLIGSFLLAHWALTRVVLGIGRARFGWRIEVPGSHAAAGRLTLAHLFAATALVAFMFSVFRWMPPEWGVYRFIEVEAEDYFEFGRMAMIDLVLAAIVIASVARPKWRVWHLAFATVASIGWIAIAIGLGVLLNDRWLIRRFPIHATTMFLVLSASLLWLRLVGYRPVSTNSTSGEPPHRVGDHSNPSC